MGSHLKESLASLDVIEADSATLNGGGRFRKPPASPRRKPTPRQRIRWKAVQQAKLRGLSIRAIARELGIHRNTVRKYAEAKSPPMMRTRAGPALRDQANSLTTMSNWEAKRRVEGAATTAYVGEPTRNFVGEAFGASSVCSGNCQRSCGSV